MGSPSRLSCVVISLMVAVMDQQSCVYAQNADAMGTAEKAQAIRVKYASANIVRNIDHIKEDLKNVISMSGDGTFTTEEAIFYLMRMHDFDENNKLDGLEIMKAYGHAHTTPDDDPDAHNTEAQQTMLEQLSDQTLKYDTDMDGYVTYSEWITGYKADRNVKHD